MKTISKNPMRKSQRGFTLVEIMVALLVMAVGMLGIAALYIESLRSGHMSVSYTNAVTLAADMADRIRANNTAQVAYAGAAAGNAQHQQARGGAAAAGAAPSGDGVPTFVYVLAFLIAIGGGAGGMGGGGGAVLSLCCGPHTYVECGVFEGIPIMHC